MNQRRTKILLVEDDTTMGYLLEDNLTMAGYEVNLCTDGQAALSAYMSGQYYLGIFDVMLPKKDGFSLAAEIRKVDKQIPIIFLTARNLKEDRIQGFQIGADDYITKPFSIEEFLLRVAAILKRTYQVPTQADQQSFLKFGDSILEVDNLQLMIGHQVLALTAKEARLLQLFAKYQNQVIARDTIQKAIWEDDGYFVGRSLDVFISRLRKMLKEDPKVSIVNLHGTGYKLKVDGDG